MSTGKRVGLIADKDAYFRLAAAAILTRHFGFSEVLEASSLDEALERLTDNAPVEIALLDLSMPGAQTPTNLRSIRECFPNTRVAAISASTLRRDILLALEAGVHGYIVRSLPVADLVKALSTIFEGGVYVPSCLAEIAPGPTGLKEQADEPAHVQPSAPQTASMHLLTSRQRDVLDLLVQGKSNKEIALALKLGEGTVKIHMAAIFRYFGVSNRAAAAVAGARPYPNRPRGVLNEGPGKGHRDAVRPAVAGFHRTGEIEARHAAV
ncbi:response regulator transcription factor [Microvirga sp. BT688]|uniref:LuxR C-terminal-related transcriptional regulator n=1 Tax=Microvirga sp. TaxID=1873136 RepID=UPI001687C4C6|nr:response regulator transcription factor [Microvirga sp.]MBD2746528.1 response regulator transcription factor [Microvirga sp.]